MLEVRALAQATAVLRQSQDIRNGPPGDHRAEHGRKELSPDAGHERSRGGTRLPLASTAMILRQVYADAPGQGAVVWKLGAACQGGCRRGRAAVPRTLARGVSRPIEAAFEQAEVAQLSTRRERWQTAARSPMD